MSKPGHLMSTHTQVLHTKFEVSSFFIGTQPLAYDNQNKKKNDL